MFFRQDGRARQRALSSSSILVEPEPVILPFSVRPSYGKPSCGGLIHRWRLLFKDEDDQREIGGGNTNISPRNSLILFHTSNLYRIIWVIFCVAGISTFKTFGVIPLSLWVCLVGCMAFGPHYWS
jgi:hypothetical protein